MTEVENKVLDIDEVTPFDKVIPRQHKWTNAMNFTEEQLIKRSNDLKELEKLYPNVPYSWLEMAWNFTESKTEEELNIIKANRLWENEDAKERILGGIVKNSISVGDK